MVQFSEKPKGGAMLKPEQEQLANEFYRAAVAPGEVDAKTKILIATAVAMTVGCYP
jgi:alkylhydroperoxidase/carboxymuconolactone decarboxylase family protein YurZ